MQKRPDVCIELALVALRKLPRFLSGRTLEEYLLDDYCQSAVERQLEIAGDAIDQLRKAEPKWFKRVPEGDLIVAFRNVLAHGYAALDPRIVYEAAAARAPALIAVREELLAELPEP